MSGSNGFAGGGDINNVACSALSITAQIATPNPELIGKVSVSEEFSVEVLTIGGQQVVAVCRPDRAVVGGLSGGAIKRLRECILAGTSYQATIVKANGPQIIVRIEPVTK